MPREIDIDGEAGSSDLNAKGLSQPRVSQIVMWEKAGSLDSRGKGPEHGSIRYVYFKF
jgi:hypothetical protein